jgi:hypothetical protein
VPKYHIIIIIFIFIHIVVVVVSAGFQTVSQSQNIKRFIVFCYFSRSGFFLIMFLANFVETIDDNYLSVNRFFVVVFGKIIIVGWCNAITITIT